MLPLAQQELLPELAAAPRMGLVLYGGTAIALRLGHRQSVDFDFFTDGNLPQPADLRASFPFLRHSMVLQNTPNTLSVSVPCETDESPVKVSFFGEIDFGRVGEPAIAEGTSLEVASLADLMAIKLKVIVQRIEAKDYSDIAAMIRAGVNLAEGLAAARILFGNEFQPSESLKALAYFEGGDLNTLSAIDRQVLVAAVRSVQALPSISLLSRSLSANKLHTERLGPAETPDDTASLPFP